MGQSEKLDPNTTDQLLTKISVQIAARFVRFAKKMASKRKLNIYPSTHLSNWVRSRIFAAADRREKVHHIAYGMAALMSDLVDDPKGETELVFIAREYFPDAEKFYDENGDLFAEAVLEGSR